MTQIPVCFPPRVKYTFKFDELTMMVHDQGEFTPGLFTTLLVNTLAQIGLVAGTDYSWDNPATPMYWPITFSTVEAMTAAKILLAS